MTTYSIQPDADDIPTLWRAESEHDQYPEAIASLFDGGEVEPVVFRAAAAVLAPPPELVERIARVIHAQRPHAHSWDDCDDQQHFHDRAHEVLAVLRAHVTEATP